MTFIEKIKSKIKMSIENALENKLQQSKVELTFNLSEPKFGDLCTNAAMVASKLIGKNPRELATQIKNILETLNFVANIEIAGPGFINIFLTKECWQEIAKELLNKKEDCFRSENNKKSFLIEFVSANPTGPLHLGHGRNAILGDVLANVLTFLGNKVTKEFYINDAGNQVALLGESLHARCLQELGKSAQIPEEGYKGEYLVEVAHECVKEHGEKLIEKQNSFFEEYAKTRMLSLIKKTLTNYGVEFDNWFSEKTLHKDGSVQKAIEILKNKNLAYEQEGALWFRSTQFGDDKDRVIAKSDGSLTYIAADIAYHKNKFDRENDKLIDIFGQDHHGYVTRLKATMFALGYDEKNLDVILYQLVSIKRGTEAVKMSKRAGAFTTLEEIIELVGKDVARFFYLNRKAEAHLEFDLDVALKKTEENPAYYIQYGYVRTVSLLKKYEQNLNDVNFSLLNSEEIMILKKVLSLTDTLKTIEINYHTHLLAHYAVELTQMFSTYYAKYRIIDAENLELTKTRIALVKIVQNSLALSLDLLGLSKPEEM